MLWQDKNLGKGIFCWSNNLLLSFNVCHLHDSRLEVSLNIDADANTQKKSEGPPTCGSWRKDIVALLQTWDHVGAFSLTRTPSFRFKLGRVATHCLYGATMLPWTGSADVGQMLLPPTASQPAGQHSSNQQKQDLLFGICKFIAQSALRTSAHSMMRNNHRSWHTYRANCCKLKETVAAKLHGLPALLKKAPTPMLKFEQPLCFKPQQCIRKGPMKSHVSSQICVLLQ